MLCTMLCKPLQIVSLKKSKWNVTLLKMTIKKMAKTKQKWKKSLFLDYVHIPQVKQSLIYSTSISKSWWLGAHVCQWPAICWHYTSLPPFSPFYHTLILFVDRLRMYFLPVSKICFEKNVYHCIVASKSMEIILDLL